MSDMLEIFLIGFGVYLFYRIAIIFLKSKKTIHTNIYEMLMLATIFMISTFAYKHQKTHILIAFLVKSNQRFTVVEAESKEEAKEKYEKQVKRDAVIKVGQLFENIRECGK